MTNPLVAKTIHIVGAGFSGLTAAYYLVKAGSDVKIEVYERAKIPGGILQTLHTPYGMIETAANAFLNSPELESLCADIGLTLLSTQPAARARFIFRGRPRRFPIRFTELLRFAQFIWRLIFARATLAPRNFESIRQWGTRNLSKQLSFFSVETALQGIYAGAPEKLSATLILSRFFPKSEKAKLKSKVKYQKGSRAPQGGMSELNEKLVAFLKAKGVQFYFQHPYHYRLTSEIPVVFALPAFETAKLLENDEPQLCQSLKNIEYLPVITANVFFKQEVDQLKGFGCLFPPEENNLILGVLFNQCIFSGRVQNAISENWILGGARVQNLAAFLALSDDAIQKLILEKRKHMVPGQCPAQTSDILMIQITRWEKAFPHYTTRLEQTLEELRPVQKNIFLHGNYLGQLGLTRLLGQSEMIAKQILQELNECKKPESF